MANAPASATSEAAALTSACRCNPDLAAFYAGLRSVGKVALTAVMRKLVVLANTLIR